MNIVKANGIDMAFDSFGREADEAILLIAGLGTQMIRWTVPFCQELAANDYRVIRFDNRDAGCSTHFNQYATPDFKSMVAKIVAGQRPDVPYTLYDMADDVIGLLNALSIDRAHVVGRSMGGNDRADPSERASRAGLVAYLHHVEHRQSSASAGRAGRHGNDDAPSAQSCLG